MAINSDAPVVTRNEIVVDAPLARIWDIHVDIDRWPQWQPEVTSAASGGPLRAGSSFQWKTAGLDITSTVVAIEPPHYIEWGGPVNGVIGRHVWHFDEQDGQVLVRTEESWEGPPVQAAVEQLQTALDNSIAAWLKHLKDHAERKPA